ncbi:hypothetical protein ABZ807_13160 [Micromonospora sp. NPDC047548]|uniref:hypothetical protein n=1 Tax=Micromonospora sp. NPDC047548 TaxID=3155624 RepID=UPI0033F65A8C
MESRLRVQGHPIQPMLVTFPFGLFVSAAVFNAGMAALFLLACLIRADAPQRGATGVLVVTELVALAVGAVGVRLGARLMREFDTARREPSGFEALDGVPAAGSTVEIIRPRA